MPSRFSHVALTVPPEQLVGVARDELLEFYGQVFAWRENEYFAIPGERILIRAPTDTQYITVRSSSAPMRTSGYEHLGIIVDSESELRSIHGRATAMRSKFPDLDLQPIESLYGDALLTFRLRFRLPLTLEIQHLRKTAHQ